jgi:CelD/BcsL family acetyltransferase involved in cellulose biosynthesis
MWLQAWWNNFGQQQDLYLLSIRHARRTIGIAPLWRNDRAASLIGNQNVCDNLDFMVASDRTAEFYSTLLNHLIQDDITRLDLGLIRPDSSAYTGLLPMAEKMGCRIHCEPAATSYEVELPDTWNAYLASLSGKERHEIRRKFRRLDRAGRVNFRVVDDPTLATEEMDTFLQLFKSNRPDKAAFMSDTMNAFFRDLATKLAAWGLLKLFFLELDEKPIAAVMCFDYQFTRYLYNNGYDSSYSALSAGLLSKVLSIKDSFQAGIKTYDFLKGTEDYKRRLGGRPVALYQCRLELT